MKKSGGIFISLFRTCFIEAGRLTNNTAMKPSTNLVALTERYDFKTLTAV